MRCSSSVVPSVATARLCVSPRVKLRVHVRHVTDLTDYTPATDLADEQWRSHLHELAHEARQQALSDRQVKSRLDSHYHEKAA